MSRLKTLIYISILCFIGLSYYGELIDIQMNRTANNLQFEQGPKKVREATDYVIRGRRIEVLTTAYSEYDSCHYEGCIMANGERAHVGAIACNFLPMGAKVEIDGVIYTVKDRHAKWLDDRIDLFFGYGEDAYNKAINYGKQIKTVKIYK